MEFNSCDYYPFLFQIAHRLDLVSRMIPRYQALANYVNACNGWRELVSSAAFKNFDETLKRKLMKEQGAVYIRKRAGVRR